MRIKCRGSVGCYHFRSIQASLEQKTHQKSRLFSFPHKPSGFCHLRLLSCLSFFPTTLFYFDQLPQPTYLACPQVYRSDSQTLGVAMSLLQLVLTPRPQWTGWPARPWSNDLWLGEWVRMWAMQASGNIFYRLFGWTKDTEWRDTVMRNGSQVRAPRLVAKLSPY